MKKGVSAAIITRDSARHLGECLKTLAWCDEIVVVDSGSTDGTLEAARTVTDKVYTEAWRGFGIQKQMAVDKCSHEWVLSVDADERISGALRDEIRGRIADPGEAVGFYIPRRNYYGGKWLRHGGQYPDYVLRLFRRGSGGFTRDLVHEKVVVRGETGRLVNPIDHYTFEDLSSRIVKLNRYSSLSASQMFESGRRAGALSPIVHGLAFFAKDYLLRLGFLDGLEGLNVALLKSLGAYLKYAKLIDYHKAGRITD